MDNQVNPAGAGDAFSIARDKLLDKPSFLDVSIRQEYDALAAAIFKQLEEVMVFRGQGRRQVSPIPPDASSALSPRQYQGGLLPFSGRLRALHEPLRALHHQGYRGPSGDSA